MSCYTVPLSTVNEYVGACWVVNPVACYSVLPRITRRYRYQISRLRSQRNVSDFPHLYERLTSRRLPYIIDYLTPKNARLLKSTLSDFIPYPDSMLLRNTRLSIGHHFVYFPPMTKLSSLLPDGTDPLHSPGAPFNRRMWAGGSIEVFRSVKTGLSGYDLREKIVDVQVKGQGSDQKVFVKIERKMYQGLPSGEIEREGDKLRILETRNIVFLRDKRQNLDTSRDKVYQKVLKPTMTPDVYHKMVPTPALLFRFSALTFNAHAIHLDKRYCQEVEGHRNLLVHGPLSVVLMLEVMNSHLLRLNSLNHAQKGKTIETVRAVEYKNLAPLYAEEEMTICLKRKEEGGKTGRFDVWIVGKDGGYAVRGLVRTEKGTPTNIDEGRFAEL